MKKIDKDFYEKEEFENLEMPESTLDSVEFINCKFKDCIFNNSVWNEISLEDCKFKNCSLANSRLQNVHLNSVQFDNCKLLGIDWGLLNITLGLKLECEKCDLSYSSFNKVVINESVFLDCKMHEVDFTEAKVRKVQFTSSDLLKSTFKSTDLEKADFRCAVNYVFDPSQNKCKGVLCSSPEVLNLLKIWGIEVENC